MRRLIRWAVVAVVACPAIGLAAGCSATRQALRSGEPKVEFHMPPAETVDVRLQTESGPRPTPPPPFSVTDEYRDRGRWLTLFQIDVTPSEAAGVPPVPAESP